MRRMPPARGVVVGVIVVGAHAAAARNSSAGARRIQLKGVLRTAASSGQTSRETTHYSQRDSQNSMSKAFGLSATLAGVTDLAAGDDASTRFGALLRDHRR